MSKVQETAHLSSHGQVAEPEVWLDTYFLPPGTIPAGLVITNTSGHWYTRVNVKDLACPAWAEELCNSVHLATCEAVYSRLNQCTANSLDPFYNGGRNDSGCDDVYVAAATSAAECRELWHAKMRAVQEALGDESVAPKTVWDEAGVQHTVGYRLWLGDATLMPAQGSRPVQLTAEMSTE